MSRNDSLNFRADACGLLRKLHVFALAAIRRGDFSVAGLRLADFAKPETRVTDTRLPEYVQTADATRATDCALNLDTRAAGDKFVAGGATGSRRGPD